jgi:hypothetical protein
MANAYWVATFEVPRGHNRRSIVLKPGVRINRLLEWKVDVAHDGLIVTALLEKQVPDPEPDELTMGNADVAPNAGEERVAAP